MSATRTFRGETGAERQARRRAALLEAVLDLVHEQGLAAVGVRGVCARAQLTSRYFYESFADLDEVLVAVLDRTTDELLAASRAAMRAAPSRSGPPWLHAGLDAAVGVIVDDPRKGTLLVALGAGDAHLQRRRRATVLRVADAVLAEAAPGRRDDARARATALYVAGGIVELTLACLGGDVALTRAELVARLAALTAPVIAAG